MFHVCTCPNRPLTKDHSYEHSCILWRISLNRFKAISLNHQQIMGLFSNTVSITDNVDAQK